MAKTGGWGGRVMYRKEAGLTDGWVYVLTCGMIDRLTDGRMDMCEQTDKLMDRLDGLDDL